MGPSAKRGVGLGLAVVEKMPAGPCFGAATQGLLFLLGTSAEAGGRG